MPLHTYNINHIKGVYCLPPVDILEQRWNDKKTRVLYDDLSTAVQEATKFGDLEFNLWELDSEGEPKQVKYKGAWIIAVDGGYLDWPTMVPPLKRYATYKERQFSKWLESMRKDVECCTFGIMKGRFRILKTGIPLNGIEATDHIWATCCALHNFLLEEDGKDIEKFICNQQSLGVFYRRRRITLDRSGMGPGQTGSKLKMEEVLVIMNLKHQLLYRKSAARA
mmetsp:Transcript_24679/g.32236  ORF Transcript_24679/g.32236 Transcript_24679/m.32236 type:complete len:223 (-) Transcript_24679:189-857(-)|eukprot:CAMPEP_0195260822 /NCGR_PEP_ID=MMETSP0706-20130129/8783_1 /TAXON_ID=33640 /ORGANISM="Asterionellopsis glacialis, Strain CCMP134" /LENGTH=222 /DNA_ID=CAMNT_0040314575 /DNA_START=180 /DNA_END=848 /DNA_ORIENTATION=+